MVSPKTALHSQFNNTLRNSGGFSALADNFDRNPFQRANSKSRPY